jgi:hypothetical protein
VGVSCVQCETEHQRMRREAKRQVGSQKME